MKWLLARKSKKISNEIEQNKTEHDFDRKTAMISALSSWDVGNYEFIISNVLLSEQDLLEKADSIKRFGYLPLGKELNSQNGIGKDQHKFLNVQINVNNNNREDGCQDRRRCRDKRWWNNKQCTQ